MQNPFCKMRKLGNGRNLCGFSVNHIKLMGGIRKKFVQKIETKEIGREKMQKENKMSKKEKKDKILRREREIERWIQWEKTRERERANISETPITGWERKYRKIQLQNRNNFQYHELKIFYENFDSNKEPWKVYITFSCSNWHYLISLSN